MKNSRRISSQADPGKPGFAAAVEPAGQGAALRRVLPEWAAAEAPVHAVFASARYLTPKVRAFIDLAAGSFMRMGRAENRSLHSA